MGFHYSSFSAAPKGMRGDTIMGVSLSRRVPTETEEGE